MTRRKGHLPATPKEQRHEDHNDLGGHAAGAARQRAKHPIEVPQGSHVFPTIGQVNCLEEMGSGLLCAATYECSDGETGQLWGDMANHNGRRVLNADSPVATRRGCAIEVNGKASVRWLAGYRPAGASGEMVGLTSSVAAMRPVQRVQLTPTAAEGSLLVWLMERYNITWDEAVEDRCGHIREGHVDRADCERNLSFTLAGYMYYGLTPYARCVVELYEVIYEPQVEADDLGYELLLQRFKEYLSEPVNLPGARHYERQFGEGSGAKRDQCWNLHLDELEAYGIPRTAHDW